MNFCTLALCLKTSLHPPLLLALVLPVLRGRGASGGRQRFLHTWSVLGGFLTILRPWWSGPRRLTFGASDLEQGRGMRANAATWEPYLSGDSAWSWKNQMV